jgi:protein-S-isoprenylcysteine O-methyltransferase Ste14
MNSYVSDRSTRRFADFLLFGVTSLELALLILQTPTFTLVDWVYVLQHLLVLTVALRRSPPKVQDTSLGTGVAVFVAYVYSYAQVIYLNWLPGNEVWPAAGLVLVSLAGALSLFSLLTLGKMFGVRPALRSLVTRGPYRFVRHPMYLAYVIGDIGYNLQEWNSGTLVIVMAGWISIVYRIRAEERVLSHDAGWAKYAESVHYRLLPGLW